MEHELNDGAATSKGGPPQRGMLSAVAKVALTKTHFRLFEQIELVNRAWLDSVEAAHKSEVELSRRLLRCTAPADAAAVCQEWMSRRVVNFVVHNHMMTKLWLDFVPDQARPGEKVK